MNGPSGQESSPWAFPGGAVPPPSGNSFSPICSEGGNTPREQTHHPLRASAPTKNIPVVLPNKLIALAQGSLYDNRCPARLPPLTVSGFLIVFNQPIF